MQAIVASETTGARWRYAGLVVLLIVVGVALRAYLAGFLHPIGQSIYSDMENYVNASREIAEGHWRVGHFFQPVGYPLLLSRLRALTPDWLEVLGWLQVAASSVTMVLVWRAAVESLGRNVGLVTLAVVAVHLPWIAYAGFAFSETVFTLLLAAMALVSVRLCRSMRVLDAVAWGGLFFTATLFKGTHVLIVPLFLVAILFFKGVRTWRTWRVLIAISVVVWTGFIAHGFYAQYRIGTFQMTASTGGLNFVEGKCAEKLNIDSTGASWLSPLYYQLDRKQEKKWDHPFTESSYFLAAGLDCIRDNPLVLVQSLEAIPFLFIGNWMWPAMNLSYRDWIKIYEMLFAFGAFVGLGAIAVLGRQREPGGAFALTWVVPVAGLLLTVYVFKSEARYRVPFDVWIIPLAIVGWQQLWAARRLLTTHRQSSGPGASG